MLMSVNITHIENFPSIGTIEGPAYAWINRKLLLSYQIAPVQPWAIIEIHGDSKTQYWKVLKNRRWVISFMDWTMDILFKDVELKEVCTDIKFPNQLLLDRTHLLKS